ncbi:LacI family DNA-binding transcriptional regulator [Antribacter gilvus]|uniref:LacI family DNA-binding transcriptional regulator n=1 Tax=Antribacter gilvus TaxID=2304675 RepID=UPI000F7B57E8|nr:LacI family DNA-binding transcriptional regulator [Antribacter gilvus]
MTSTGRRDQKPTIRDVAHRAQVSVATVSRVLAGNYPTSAASQARVRKAVADLDYVANAHARALSSRRSNTVAIVLANVTTPFYAAVAQGAQDEAARQGRLCLIGTTGGDAARELATIELLREQGAETVVLVGGFHRTPEHYERLAPYATSLAAVGSRLVLCARPGLGPDAPAHVVTYDNEHGAFAAVSHLLSYGHRRVLLVGGREGWTTSDDRVAGWRRALGAHGAQADPGLLVLGEFGDAFGYRRVSERLAQTGGEPDFTAVFAYDDHVALGVLRALREAGLRVPHDVSVVGYDDVPLAAHLAPALTTVSVPMEELGRTAVRVGLDPGASPTGSVVLGTHLVLRDSVEHAATRRPAARE